MKFLAQAALCLAAAMAPSASMAGKTHNIERALDNTADSCTVFVAKGHSSVNPENKVFYTPMPIHCGISKLVPRDDTQGRKLAEWQKENAAAQALHGRKLEETVANVTPKDGSAVSGQTVTFVVNVGSALSATIVLFEAGKANTINVPVVEADILNGVATVDVVGIYEAEWTWHAEVPTVGSGRKLEDAKTLIQTFSYGPEPVIVRNGGSTLVTEGEYTGGGEIQGATGRIYFSSEGWDYACTGTAIKDNKTGRSIVLTAAHCVWDDIDGNFGAKAIFIPNRDATSSQLDGQDIHRECADDICGCWSLSGGVVHDKWRDTPYPARLEFDYGFWVVDDVGKHDGHSCGSDALDEAVVEQELVLGEAVEGEFINAFGYSLDKNPDFRYCAEPAAINQPVAGTDTWWADDCLLTGGASGGPWVKDFDSSTGTGKIVSVNSWSYQDGGMGGPIIQESEARCLVNAARDVDIAALEAEADHEEGIFVNCYDRPCIDDEETARRLRGDGRKLCDENKK